MKVELSILVSLLPIAACAHQAPGLGNKALTQNPVVVTIAVGGIT